MSVLWRKFLLVLLMGVWANTSQAAPIFGEKVVGHRERSIPYLSGREIYEVTPQIHTNENGFFVPVPVDYDHPERGTFEIYGFAPGGFDPARPTAVYFTGGPGFSAHAPVFASSARSILAVGYNAIFFDQRGLGYSRPQTVAVYSDPDFYGALNTIRDADEIRKHLGLKSWVVVGGSYGTVPAQMYAHGFPSVTDSVVLISTTTGMRRSAQIRENFLRILKKRPDFKAAEASIRAVKRLPLTHSSSFAGVQKMIEILENYAYLRGTWDMHLLMEYFVQNPTFVFSVLSERGNSAFEFVMPTPEALLMNRDEFVAFFLSQDERQYNYEDYVIRAPVTYIQGGGDPRTPASGAMRHWKSVARGPSQMILIQDAGHSVFRDELAVGFGDKIQPTPYPIPSEVLSAAFRGDFSIPQQVSKNTVCMTHLIGSRPFRMWQVQRRQTQAAVNTE